MGRSGIAHPCLAQALLPGPTSHVQERPVENTAAWFHLGTKSMHMRAKSLQLCLTQCNPIDFSLPGSSVHGDSPGKNTRVGCHAFPQGLFLSQELNLQLLRLLHWPAGSLPPVPPEKPPPKAML